MSAFSLAMPQSDPRLPLSAPDPQPQRFIDKYRPSRLADVVGQGAVIFELAEFVANPYPSAWFLSGPTGTGKSSVARCVAAEIGAVEFGGLYTINSGTQDADCVLETLKDCTRAPMMVRGASGWRCIIVEECDHISPKAKQIWLSGLDDLPPKTVVIFTTNYPEKLDERFLTRGKHLRFESRADVIMQDVQTLCDHIADREGIPRVDCRNLPNITDTSGAISFRRVADAMQSATLKHRVMTRLDSSPLATSPAPAPVVPPPVIPADVPPPPPVPTSPVAEVAAPRRKRNATGKRRMSALETAESALADGNPSAESGPIRAIQEIANADHVWIRAEGSDKRTWRLHTPSPAGFVPTTRTMDASDAIACVLAHASHKPIPVPPLSDSAEVAAVSPVRIQASRPDRRKRINALGSKLESRMQAIHERIKEYNGLVRSHVRAHLAVIHTSGGPESCGVIRRARAALDKLRPIRESLMFEFGTFNARLGKIGWNTWNGGERPSAIPVLMIPDWYSDPVDVAPPVAEVAEVAEVAAPTVEIPADVPVLSSIDDVRGIPNPHVAIVSVNARGETYGNYRCDGTVWERIPTFPGETSPRIAHDSMGYYLRRGDAIPVASWRIGAFPTTPEGRDVTPTVHRSRVDLHFNPIAKDVRCVSIPGPGRVRIRHGMNWILYVADAEGTYWRNPSDVVGTMTVARWIHDGSYEPCPVPAAVGFRPDPSPSAPVEILPSAEVASGSQSDVAIMSVTVHSARSPIVQHATDEFRDGIPCMLMTSAGRMSDADRSASRERDRVWRRALSPLANRIRKPRPVPPPPSDPVPPPPPREFSGLTIGVKGQGYGLSVIPGGFRLESPRGDVYDVVPSTDEATSNHGYHCDCPDHATRHAGVGTKGCKHVHALREVGLIPPIESPAPTPPPSDPGPDDTPSPGREFSESIDTVFAGDLPYLIREHTDMSGNRVLSAWMRDNGDGRHTMTYTDAEGNRWGAMNSRLMHPRDVQAMQDASELEQLQTAKDWRESQLEWCYATIEWARPDAIGGRRNYGTITIGPVAPPDPDRPRGIFDGIDRYPYWEITETLEPNGERRLDAWTIPAFGDQFGTVRTTDNGTLGLFRTLNFTGEQREQIQRAPVAERSRMESQLVFNQWIRCYLVIEAYRSDVRSARRDNGSLFLPPARSARPIPSDPQDSGRRHTFGRVTLDRESGVIRIHFDSKPIAYERRLLREDGWRWDNGGACWVKPYSEAAEDFAARYL